MRRENICLKSDPHVPKKFVLFPLKVMKNAFYFILKALFILRYLSFCPGFCGQVGKWLDRKAKVNSKIYDVTTWETNIYNVHTVDSLIGGHHWGKDYCPLIRGVRLLESL